MPKTPANETSLASVRGKNAPAYPFVLPRYALLEHLMSVLQRYALPQHFMFLTFRIRPKAVNGGA